MTIYSRLVCVAKVVSGKSTCKNDKSINVNSQTVPKQSEIPPVVTNCGKTVRWEWTGNASCSDCKLHKANRHTHMQLYNRTELAPRPRSSTCTSLPFPVKNPGTTDTDRKINSSKGEGFSSTRFLPTPLLEGFLIRGWDQDRAIKKKIKLQFPFRAVTYRLRCFTKLD